MAAKKYVKIELSEEQIKCYEIAVKRLMGIGIPITTEALIQILALNRAEDKIVNDFLTLMHSLVNKGRKSLRSDKNKSQGLSS
jgi:hypothetical protein